VAPFKKTLGPITGPTNNRQTVIEAVDAISSSAAPRSSILTEASALLAGAEGRRAIVLVTDGYDEHSHRAVEERSDGGAGCPGNRVRDRVGGVAGISLKGERFLRQLAKDTGGRAFFPSREEELPTVHELVASDVKPQVPDHLHAQEPEGRRHVATGGAAGTDTSWKVLTATRLLRSQARAGPALGRIHDQRPRAPLLDVSRDDLVVVEDGVEQTVDSFQEAVDPVSIVMILDESGSMAKAADAVKAAARSFVSSVRAEDSLARGSLLRQGAVRARSEHGAGTQLRSDRPSTSRRGHRSLRRADRRAHAPQERERPEGGCRVEPTVATRTTRGRRLAASGRSRT